jgi:hypothetical protein
LYEIAQSLKSFEQYQEADFMLNASGGLGLNG